MASSSGEVAFERAVAMATSASIALYHDELAVNMQTQEVVRLSSADYAFELQLLEVIRISSSHDSTHPPRLDGDDQSDHSSHEIPLSMVGPSSSSGSRIVDSFVLPSFASSDDSDDDEDCNSIIWHRDGKQPVTRHTGIWISDGPQVSHSLAVSTPAIDVKLCPICYDTKSNEEMYTHESCFQTFCTACVAQHIHHSLERRVPIRCAGLACTELLNPEHCKAFIPVECYDAWVVAAIEADIPASEKLFCPFPDCSALLLKPAQDNNSPSEVEYNEENIDENNIGPNAECPFCNRLFCMRCESPWHSGLSCARFQELPTEERTESDLYLARMIDQNKWKQCRKCKRVIEKNDGCNHMTCRCGHQFCYVCGSDWQAIHPCVAT